VIPPADGVEGAGDEHGKAAATGGEVGEADTAGKGKGYAGMALETADLPAESWRLPTSEASGTVARLLNTSATYAKSSTSTVLSAPARERAILPARGGGEGGPSVSAPRATPPVSAASMHSANAQACTRGGASMSMVLHTVATAAPSASTATPAPSQAKTSTLLTTASPCVMVSSPTGGLALRPPLPPSHIFRVSPPGSNGAGGDKASAMATAAKLAATATVRLSSQLTPTRAHTHSAADHQSEAATLAGLAALTKCAVYTRPRHSSAPASTVSTVLSCIAPCLSALSATMSTSISISTSDVATQLPSSTAMCVDDKSDQALAKAGVVGLKRGRDYELRQSAGGCGVGREGSVDGTLLRHAKVLVEFQAKIAAEGGDEGQRDVHDLRQGERKKRQANVDVALNAASCGRVTPSTTAPTNSTLASDTRSPSTAQAQGPGGASRQSSPPARAKSFFTNSAHLVLPSRSGFSRTSSVSSTPSLATPPVPPDFSASAPTSFLHVGHARRGGGRQGGGGQKNMAESEAYENVGIGRKAGTDGFVSEMYPKYSFETAEAAAWGHDVLCMQHTPDIGPSNLIFGSHSAVIRKVLDACKVIFEVQPVEQDAKMKRLPQEDGAQGADKPTSTNLMSNSSAPTNTQSLSRGQGVGGAARATRGSEKQLHVMRPG